MTHPKLRYMTIVLWLLSAAYLLTGYPNITDVRAKADDIGLDVAKQVELLDWLADPAGDDILQNPQLAIAWKGLYDTGLKSVNSNICKDANRQT